MRPEDLKFAESHEWVKLDGKTATVVLSDYATSQLGDIVFLELPVVGAEVKSGESFATIESVKAASDVYSPVTGKIIEANSELESAPEKVNQDCFGQGWIAKIELSAEPEPDKLMDAAKYEEFLK